MLLDVVMDACTSRGRLSNVNAALCGLSWKGSESAGGGEKKKRKGKGAHEGGPFTA